MVASTVGVKPNDLTCVVDAPRSGTKGGRRIVDIGEEAAAIEEAVAESVGNVSTYDLAQIVDAIRLGEAARRIVESGVGAVAV